MRVPSTTISIYGVANEGVRMTEKIPVKMDQKDLDFFEALLAERRRKLVSAQMDSENTNVFHSQKDQGGELAGYSNHLADAASDYTSLETNFDLNRMCTGKIITKTEYKNDRYEELSSERILKNYAMKTYNYKGN